MVDENAVKKEFAQKSSEIESKFNFLDKKRRERVPCTVNKYSYVPDGLRVEGELSSDRERRG